MSRFGTKTSVASAKKKKKKNLIDLARVHADKSEVRGTTGKAALIPRAVNAGVECFGGS